MADFEKLNDGTHRVNVGYETLHICKLYGPTIFADLTVVSISGEDACWIVYRNGKEWCRIPAQLDEEFADEDGEEPE